MATNTNTDLTEEDAADLQFPKGRIRLCPSYNNILDHYLQKIRLNYRKLSRTESKPTVLIAITICPIVLYCV